MINFCQQKMQIAFGISRRSFDNVALNYERNSAFTQQGGYAYSPSRIYTAGGYKIHLCLAISSLLDINQSLAKFH